MFPSVLRSPTFSWAPKAPTRHPFLPALLSWEWLLDRQPSTNSISDEASAKCRPSSPLSGLCWGGVVVGCVEMWHGFQVFTFSSNGLLVQQCCFTPVILSSLALCSFDKWNNRLLVTKWLNIRFKTIQSLLCYLLFVLLEWFITQR